MDIDSERRRHTFDEVPLLYDQARPGYPDALFDDVIALSHIAPDGRILEIGCGTGQATVPFARRGYRIHCIELGAHLAAVARRNLAPYPHASVSVGAFEAWPVADEPYDLVISATAFHWVDPTIRYQKAARVLSPEGAIALFWNHDVQSERTASFFRSVQTIYDRVVTGMARPSAGLPPLENEIATPVKDELERTGLFREVAVRRYSWSIQYNTVAYFNLLNTHSDHRSLEDAILRRLLHDIAGLIDARFGGQITKEYLTILYLAHRRWEGRSAYRQRT